jgi:hypothetical protein
MEDKSKLHFNVDLPQLITEISNNHGMWSLRMPLSILQNKLIVLSKRAIELDDPELNIIMLELKLYEVKHHSQIQDLIEAQRKRLK